MTPQRIVSLIPSATEIVAAVGYEQCLVGRSYECDVPAAVKRLTVCSEPPIDESAEIMAEILHPHPHQGASRHCGTGWQRLSFG